MMDRLKIFMGRLRERLWLRPLAMCVLSVGLASLAKAADYGDIDHFVPNVSAETIETLLKIIAASMLVIATFAVGSMVSSYASASDTATPRSFLLVISDDVSQNALSSFIGSFIFSIVSLIALLNGFYGRPGRFALFCLTLFAFAAVILTFMRWVDRISRLGRLGTTVDKAESLLLSLFKPAGGHPRSEACRCGHAPIKGTLFTERRWVTSSESRWTVCKNVRRNQTCELRSLRYRGLFPCPDGRLRTLSLHLKKHRKSIQSA